MNVLTIDFGNTRSKWKLFGAAKESGVFTASLPSVSELAPFVGQIDAIVCGSVRDSRFNDLFSERCRVIFSLSPEFVKVGKAFGELTNSYTDPGKMGVDRWLAMIAAWDLVHDKCVVIDLGTAITVDVVDAQGFHSGGYIVPGLDTLVAALNLGASLIDVPVIKESELGLGNNTAAAVSNGCTQMLVAFIEAECVKYQGARILVTGGGAQGIIKHLSARCEYLPDIVLDGIFLAGSGSVK